MPWPECLYGPAGKPAVKNYRHPLQNQKALPHETGRLKFRI
jgi:hypothetical protein